MTRTEACPAEFLALAERLAEAAGAITLPYFRSRLSVEEKADLSPVTIADREAEARLREMIGAAFPGHGIVGEEYGIENREAEFVWVLDPIDGTKAFITGNPLFGTLIALARGGRPILGIADMPALAERWTGADGRGARFRDRFGEREVHVRPCPGLARAILRNTSPAMFSDRADLTAYERLRGQVRLTLYGGDCYCYGQLASGYVDLVLEAGLKSYDFMALLPVVSAAGGISSDWQGRPLSIESDGHLLVAGDPAVHSAALEILAGEPNGSCAGRASR